MSDVASFGAWLRRRRRSLDITQEDLAHQVGCAVVTIRKIETDERRPSRQLAELLARCLYIAPEHQAEFLRQARAVPSPPELTRLPIDQQSCSGQADVPGTMPLPTPLVGSYFTFLDKGHPEGYRRETIAQLAQAIRARENRLVLGLPGMGVSNLLRFLVARGRTLIPQAVFAYYDCDTQAHDTDCAALYEALATQLAEQMLGRVANGMLGYEQLRRLIQQIDGNSDARIVIVIDQADRLVAAVDRSFYHQLKALTNLNKRVCIVLAASPRLAASVDPDDLLFAGRRLAVGQLSARDCQDAIAEEARRLDMHFDTATEQSLAQLSGGHPGLLRALASAVAGGALAGVAGETMAAAPMLARDDVRYRCRKLWNMVPPELQVALLEFALGQPVSEAARAWLCEFGLIERRRQAEVICSPIMQLFVQSQAAAPTGRQPAPNALMPVTIVRPTCNERGIVVAGQVRQGDNDLAVSPLMLRVLACLLRERKIYTRQEIIAYAWFGMQVEGVSSAALDDVIRQVRQRLGRSYIKTHRGQGYEWMGP